MNTWKLVKLNFGRSPAHFGELGIGIEETSERVRSDTLFSAWMSVYARLFGKVEVEKLLKQFLLQPPMRISSTFIYREDKNHTIYYLPRPLNFPINYPKDDLEFFKTYKKLSYLPLEVWQRWYHGVGFIGGDREELITETKGKSQGHLQQARTFDYQEAIEISQLPKIAVDRITRAWFKHKQGMKLPFTTLDELLKICHEFAQKQWDYENNYWQEIQNNHKAGGKNLDFNYIREFYEVEKCPHSLRLGWGSGMTGTTVDLLLEDELREKIRDTCGLKAPGFEAPKSRRTVMNPNGEIRFVPGWVKFKT